MKQKSELKMNEPLISSQTNLPEITLKVIIVGILLAVLLGAADAYLALKIGYTIAASIPAAVISMGIFRFFKNSNVLENNLVQTAASAGEGLAAISAFILPALIISGYWSDFKFWQIIILISLGGMLGVFLSVPLRKVLLNHPALVFPEGTAVGNVLKTSATGTKQLGILLKGIFVGGFIGLAQTGFQILTDHLPAWFKSNNTLFGLSFGFNPALLGVGYIVGINAGLTMFLGTILGWVIGVPILSHVYGIPSGVSSAEDMVMTLWSQHIRYIGVGAMLVGGVWTLLTMIKPVVAGLKITLQATKLTQQGQQIVQLRTDKDLNIRYVISGVILFAGILFFAFWHSIDSSHLPISGGLTLGISFLSTILLLVLGLASCLIAGYIVGLVGSSNTPISGINIMNLLLLSLILFPVIALQVNLKVHVYQQSAIAIVIFVLTAISAATTITLENIQDLKAGQILGATPWKQQLMLMVGVIAAAFAVTPTLHLLFQAYGMGGVFPHPGMDPAQMLPVPQSGLLATVSQGIIGGNLPWPMFITGALIGIVAIIVDEYLKRKGTGRLPALGVGIGIYLPPELVTCIFLGGLIRFFANRTLQKKLLHLPKAEQQTKTEEGKNRGILLACGLVAGTALMGVILAIPFVIKGNSDVLRLAPASFAPISKVLSTLVTIAICIWLYKINATSEK